MVSTGIEEQFMGAGMQAPEKKTNLCRLNNCLDNGTEETTSV